MATMESPQEFTARATRMQYEAICLSRQISGDNAELNRWMSAAKQRGITWVDGLSFSIERMKWIPA